ncbi:substrate-binding domain-containing protein [Novosphingobium guangzhouense]|uniref:Transcriptional regulator LacI/GalR-like sensor domain-containing protein n=1 Tax=Novosphingobium guangzhouense TaxID=1850347 RepID=A0A2K2G6D3_9SPHN|nr:substrate-binding domain-containing protein [Novosphingobium guangzhouense]PNU06538.1 hypothetical protein A8V01_03090 [Novosphingobium guangzhouense]
MTSPEAPVSTRGPRAHKATAIERAGYLPERRARPRPAETAPGATPAAASAVILLVHDGHEQGLRETVERGIAAALADGTHLPAALFLPPDDAVATLAGVIERHRPSGIVLMPPLSARQDLADLCLRMRTRCIRLGTEPALSCDERGAAALAVGRLVALGHARIGLVAGPETSVNARQRELGYLDAMAEHGLDRGPALIVPGDDSFDSGIAAGRLLLEISPRPTAILAANDAMAAGVLQAAAQAGVPVPAALSVLGFDDTPLARCLLPPLASVRLPWDRMAFEGARRLLGATGPSLGPFEVEVVERGSLGPAA